MWMKSHLFRQELSARAFPDGRFKIGGRIAAEGLDGYTVQTRVNGLALGVGTDVQLVGFTLINAVPADLDTFRYLTSAYTDKDVVMPERGLPLWEAIGLPDPDLIQATSDARVAGPLTRAGKLEWKVVELVSFPTWEVVKRNIASGQGVQSNVETVCHTPGADFIPLGNRVVRKISLTNSFGLPIGFAAVIGAPRSGKTLFTKNLCGYLNAQNPGSAFFVEGGDVGAGPRGLAATAATLMNAVYLAALRSSGVVKPVLCIDSFLPFTGVGDKLVEGGIPRELQTLAGALDGIASRLGISLVGIFNPSTSRASESLQPLLEAGVAGVVIPKPVLVRPGGVLVSPAVSVSRPERVFVDVELVLH